MKCPICGGAFSESGEIITTIPPKTKRTCSVCGEPTIMEDMQPTAPDKTPDEQPKRIAVDEMHRLVTELCAKHGYQIGVFAVGKKSGKLSPWIDVVADTHVVDMAYVEVQQNGATA